MEHLAVCLRVSIVAPYDLVATTEGSFRHVLLGVSWRWSLKSKGGGPQYSHCTETGIIRNITTTQSIQISLGIFHRIKTFHVKGERSLRSINIPVILSVQFL